MDQLRLKSLLRYEPDTGHFFWIETRGPAKAGNLAGSPCNKGYIVIGVGGRVYKAHRLAWLYMTGGWPLAQIDHINQQKGDNRWANLREATNQQNCCNRTRRNKHGYPGVSRGPYGGFLGRCQVAGERLQKGGFPTAQAAHEWVQQQRSRLHGPFAHRNISTAEKPPTARPL